MILPGATLGILGGGQLGRMFTVAARTMGYRVMVLEPDEQSPAGQLADQHLVARYDDQDALEKLGRSCAAVTTEFENIPAASLEYVARHCPVRPSAHAVAMTQDRIREKTFIRDAGIETARFVAMHGPEDFTAALEQVGLPALLKTSRFGYDGKGQALVRAAGELSGAYARLGSQSCVLEELLDLEKEISVVVARGTDGRTVAYPVVENIHTNGILDISIVPVRAPPAVAGDAVLMAERIAGELDYCGVLAVEFFLLKEERLLVNEIAPRPHNSGHYTVDACPCSQFEQQVRALCGLPLGDSRLLRPAAMVNLLGDIWREGNAPPWEAVLRNPRAKLHLYGKQAARPGRKMGHCTVLDETPEMALSAALAIRRDLSA
jgi:5-(carboxyamino)imidazole ribonucleotide synthase